MSEKLREVEREIAGIFIFSSDNMLLVGKTGAYADYWVIPGGGIEEGETSKEAAIREAKEETGLDLSNEEMEEVPGVRTGETEKPLRDTGERVLLKMNFHDHKVVLAQKAADIVIRADDDFTNPRWIPVEELAEAPLSPPAADGLKALGIL